MSNPKRHRAVIFVRPANSNRWGKRCRRSAHFAHQDSREPRRKSVPTKRHRSFESPDHAPRRERKRKTGPLCSSQLHKGPDLYCLAAIPTAPKDISDPLERFRLASGLRPGGGNFLGADTATSFSLRSSLPFSWWLLSRSSLLSSLSWPCRPLKNCSVNIRRPCIDMRNIETISQKQN
jgi:hypothetical protein